MKPAPPVTRTLTRALAMSRSALSAVLEPAAAGRARGALADAESAEDVREGAHAGQRERDVETLVLRHDEAADVRVVVGLVLDADAAALGVVEEADPLLHQRLLRQVEVEVIGAAQVAAAEGHIGARAQEVVRRPELGVDDLQVL